MLSDWKMDVTSLLNQSAASGCDRIEGETTPTSAVFKQGGLKSASLPTPSPERTTPQQDWESISTKNRTPWSAGGYALPLQSEPEFRSSSIFSFRSGSEVLDSDSSVDSLGLGRHSRHGSMDSASIDMESSQTFLPSSRLQSCRPSHWEERSQTGIETREPMGHKFSDSHSSLSSYASWKSRSHSRISSVTTVSGIHSAGPSLTELPLLETAMASHGESYQTPTSANRTPHLSGGRLPTSNRIGEMDVPRRSGSPSDAVLNMKGAIKTAQTGTSTGDSSSREPRFPGLASSHKRAISAPDSSIATEYFRGKHSQHPRSLLPPPREVMAIAEDTSSLAVGQSSPQNEELVGTKYNVLDNTDNSETDCQDERPIVAAPKPMRTLSSPDVLSSALANGHQQLTKPSNPPTTQAQDLDGKAACMFVEDCDTGSQLRKAISHLFGRNKTCTLKIPKMVWVYYCRKHYQRVRYRNAKTYPITQMELVQTQIERLKAWSDRNRATGEGPYINSWTLSLRKREEKRLQGDKRRHERGTELPEVGTGHIPAWIIEELGEGYDTERMFKIAGRLRKEIKSGILTQVPEIEFLPDIVGDDKDKETTKSARQRRQNSATSVTKTPKRKAPDFQVMTQPGPVYHDMGYAGYVHDGGYDAEGVVSPSGKRPRTGRAASFFAGPSNPYTASSYLAGSEGPPRAQNVVPKIQPIDYHNPYAHNASNGRFEHTHPVQGHGRVASYSCVPPESEYAPEPYYQHHKAPGYGRMPVHFSGSQSSPNSPPMLPSITAQINSTCISHPRHESPLSGARSHTRASSRPMHQRSASAYTPGRRAVPMLGRPSSSGNGHTMEHVRYEANRQVPPPAMYDAGHHGPQSYAEGDLRHHHYDGKPVWDSTYAHPAPPLPNLHNQYSYAHGPSYGSPLHAGMPPHNGVLGDAKNGMSVYPEPKRTSGLRSA